MKKLLLILVGMAFLSSVNAQSFKFSVGYGLPWLSQQIGTNTSSTYSTALDPETQMEVPRVTNASKIVKGSFGAGLNVSGAFGYTLSENIGLELGISYSAGKEYRVASNYTDIRLDVFKSSTYESETSKSRAVLFAPLLKFITHKRNLTPYFLIGPVFGKINFNRTMVRSIEENDFLTTEVRNTKYKGGISVGLRGAVGASVILNRKFSVFSEIMFTGMNYYPKQSEIVRYTINGEDRITSLTENSRKTLYVKSVDNDSDNASDYVNAPGKAVRSALSMSSVGANIGLLINLN